MGADPAAGAHSIGSLIPLGKLLLAGILVWDSAGRGRIEVATPDPTPVLEHAGVTDMQSAGSVPLRGEGHDDVLSFERGSVVEGHVLAQVTGPNGRVFVGLACGRERRRWLN